MPQRLRCIDVAESGDHALIEENRFDRGAAPRELRPKPIGREIRITRLQSEPKIRRRVRSVEIERTECARIIQHHTRPIIERDRRTREAWERIGRSVDRPVAGHSKVRVKRTAIIELKELVLPAPFDRADTRSAKRA